MMRLFETVTAVSASKPWFASLLERGRDRWHQRTHPAEPISSTAAPVEVQEIWSRQRAGLSRVLSVLGHVGMVSLALMPWPSSTAPMPPPSGVIDLALYTPQMLDAP